MLYFRISGSAFSNVSGLPFILLIQSAMIAAIKITVTQIINNAQVLSVTFSSLLPFSLK